ncbi:MAG: recombinase family protein [Lachnospiraceae bacterium]|nr:recombinase family protein [Lachnospiraceae bacterium]
MAKRAVFYARVSTQEEAQLKALPKQVEECREHIKAKGWKIVDQYVDEGKSGTTTKHRNEYQRLLDDMELNKFDVLVVKSQDRLQRNPRDWYIFVDKLNSNGIELYFYLEGRYFKSDEDALITGIKAILAGEYSRDLSKKLNNSNKRRIEKARNGEAVSAMGNSQMYGYQIVDGKWVVNESQREVVSKMYELYLELHSIRKVRDALNEMGYRNQKGKLFTEEIIARVIRNEKHKGWVILNRFHRNFDTKEIDELPEEEWVIVKDDHEPIVSEEVWDKVNNEIDSHRNKGNTKQRARKVGDDPLSCKMFCGCCGRVLWKHTTRGSYKIASGERVNQYKAYSQWYCSGKMGRGELACEDPATISGVQLNKYLLEMADRFLDFSTIEYSKSLLKKRSIGWLQDLRAQLTIPNDNSKIEAEIDKLEVRKSKLIDLYTDELISKEDFMVKSRELDSKLADKRALLVPVEDNPDIKAIDDTIANIDREIEELFADEAMVEEKKIQFITDHIKKIVVLSNKDIFIILDNVAGAFLFIDKGEAMLDVVPVEGFDAGDIEDLGITEGEIVPFDRESMPFHNGAERHDPLSEGGSLRAFI